MKFVPFDVDASLRETTRHGSEDFPVAVYMRRMNNAQEGNLILHWHEELQFVIPISGSILFTVSDEPYILSPGSYLFINSRRLHMAKPLDSGDGAYICVNIHPRFLYGYGSSLISRSYVQPFLASDAFSALLLDDGQSWHSQARALLDQMVAMCDEKDYAYELAVQKAVLELWLLIIRHHQDKSAAGRLISQGDQERLDQILAFMQERYGEKITLGDIAGAASISRSEAGRCFQAYMGCSPVDALIQHRLQMAHGMLHNRTHTLQAISHACGFSSVNYFSRQFRKHYGYAPSLAREPKNRIDTAEKKVP